MKYDMNIYDLGQLLYRIVKEYNVEIMTKIKLSGGWMTLTGEVEIISIPEDRVVIKGNNIITLKIKDTGFEGSTLKITGAKNGVFNVDISPTKFKELGTCGLTLNKTKMHKSETKLRIDEDMIFTIRKAPVEDVENLIKNIK